MQIFQLTDKTRSRPNIAELKLIRFEHKHKRGLLGYKSCSLSTRGECLLLYRPQMYTPSRWFYPTHTRASALLAAAAHTHCNCKYPNGAEVHRLLHERWVVQKTQILPVHWFAERRRLWPSQESVDQLQHGRHQVFLGIFRHMHFQDEKTAQAWKGLEYHL